MEKQTVLLRNGDRILTTIFRGYSVKEIVVGFYERSYSKRSCLVNVKGKSILRNYNEVFPCPDDVFREWEVRIREYEMITDQKALITKEMKSKVAEFTKRQKEVLDKMKEIPYEGKDPWVLNQVR